MDVSLSNVLWIPSSDYAGLLGKQTPNKIQNSHDNALAFRFLIISCRQRHLTFACAGTNSFNPRVSSVFVRKLPAQPLRFLGFRESKLLTNVYLLIHIGQSTAATRIHRSAAIPLADGTLCIHSSRKANIVAEPQTRVCH